MAKKKSDEQAENVDEPNFEDPEDFVDDVSDQGEPSLSSVCRVSSELVQLKIFAANQNMPMQMCSRMSCQHGHFTAACTV